ncbi:MAG: 23S rRNA (guanosine(2251)-2'-O)-methyltransferase RlmB [Flavobacteriales bacterium]|nr:23S rRNA (guanosine(2251)-2'-O)-methyltransferase RlmB [Flavobacteriales bacterium]MCB9195766.1 23S rRNA (guanosine(2251)-2'-O)-methyltransferase RlmB [Flavobacteriales bacterium]MCB9198820.1 23S rRNA (guanosine(2251)-2'-O)-methyltransferase RlmB [Flavobacteriales bacterium]
MRENNRVYTKKEDENLIYGTRAVIEALDAGRMLNRVFIQNGVEGEIFKELRNKMKEHEIVFQMVPVQKLNRLTQNNHQGVVAYASPIEYQSLDDIITRVVEKGEVPLIFILDRVTDVRNMGSIARSAECHGVHAIVIPSRGNAGVTADAIKTSAGALNKIPVCRENHLKDAILICKQHGIKVVSCTEKTENLIYDVDLKGALAIIMGSEEDGVSKEYLKVSDEKVKIPMEGTIASLNVAVSAGIVMYEVNRQRNI